MRRLIAILGILVLSLAACGNDDDPSIIDSGDTSSTAGDDIDDTDPGDDTDDTGSDDTDSDDDTTTTTTEPERVAYEGGYEVDTSTGIVDISAYEAFLAEHGSPPGGPQAAAVEMIGPSYEIEPGVSSMLADGGRTVVTLEFTDLADDSVEAERYEVVFVGDEDDLIIESASWASRCQEGRGHQEYQAALCL